MPKTVVTILGHEKSRELSFMWEKKECGNNSRSDCVRFPACRININLVAVGLGGVFYHQFPVTNG